MGRTVVSTPKDLVGNPSKRQCPGSFSNLGCSSSTTNRDVPPLRRWKATWAALSAELDEGRPADTNEEPFDPVQRAIVAAQITRAKPRLPVSDGETFDFDWPHLSYPIDHEEFKVFFQFAHTDSDGFLKMYRLKTAQIREDAEFVSSPEEIAAVVSDPRFPDSLEAYELRTTDGELIRLEMAQPQAQELLSKLERDYQKMMEADPKKTHPGLHCSMCDVADRCPTFPAIDPSAAVVAPKTGRRLPSAHRLMFSKSRLGEMSLCERRAAWKSWYSIPPDTDSRFRETSPGLAVGNRFHHRMAEALLSDNPISFFKGDPEIEDLYRQHRQLPCTETLRIKATEFPLGFTVRFRTDQRSVSVVQYGLADAVGRELDGTPAIIDHKTGRPEGNHPYEAEIYAFGALLRIGEASKVATHLHRLSTRGEEPVCERRVWGRDQINQLASRLTRLAEAAAQWDLRDATSPPFRVGEWCATCPFEQRCLTYR